MQKLDNKHRKHFYVALYERVSKDDKDGKKESEIEQCRKQVYDIDKKIEIEKSKHTISYNQIKKLSEEFLSSDKITKQVL